MTWDRNKPIGFLQTKGRASLIVALEFRECVPGGGASAICDNLERLSELPDAQKAEVLSGLFDKSDLMARVPVPVLHNLIFLDPSDIVCGLALLAVLRAFNRESTRQAIRRIVAGVLVAEYSIDPSLAAYPMADVWLVALQTIEESIRQDFLSDRRSEPSVDADAVATAMQDLDTADTENVLRALRVLERMPPRSAHLVDRLFPLVTSSSHPGIRMLAADILSEIVSGPDCTRLSRVLARIVRDANDNWMVREIAYQLLHRVNNTPVNTWPEYRKAVGHFIFPDDVDWDFVERFE